VLRNSDYGFYDTVTERHLLTLYLHVMRLTLGHICCTNLHKLYV